MWEGEKTAWAVNNCSEAGWAGVALLTLDSGCSFHSRYSVVRQVVPIVAILRQRTSKLIT